ncbi:MAG TPA: methylated-DNA--[protein]-cysteine S-methyltransferase [Casimicrobiaceae bacterium]|jgi:methylated-DNA-[protein]-cysteine S-methyltransferase
MNRIIRYCWTKSPLGDVLLVANGDALSGVYFADQKYLPPIDPAWQEDQERAVLRSAHNQLGQYFAGSRRRFELTLAPTGTPFQRAVWNAIAQVPWGETLTYAELASRVGHPGSARAAGAATGRNPLSIVVPCHRIVGSDGSLTGYAGGLDRKRKLLVLEQPLFALARQAA